MLLSTRDYPKQHKKTDKKTGNQSEKTKGKKQLIALHHPA